MGKDTRNASYDMEHMSQLLGCRAPSSRGVGISDNVFMYVASDEITKTVLFENGAFRFLDNDKFLEYYNYFLDRGWRPMTLRDLRLTSGLNGAHYFQSERYNKAYYIIKGFVATLGVGLVWLFLRRRTANKKKNNTLAMSAI